MNKIISLLLAVILCLTGIAVSASEVGTQSIIWGDTDGDGDVTIIDATCIQRYLVEIPVLSFHMEAAIVSGEDDLSIIDATLIQRKLVNLIDRFPVEEQIQPTEEPATTPSEMKMVINDTPVTFEWEDNESAAALKEAVKNDPLTIQMSMYGGFEQVGSLGMPLPRNDTRLTTQPGDVILYSGNQMVVFYGSNTWAYTRLGHISDKTTEELTQLLSNDNVTITLTY